MQEDRVMRIDRKSSIETEPRTLPNDQLHYAREAALYVMNTRSVEEAVTIFTEGLEPVVSVGKEGSRRREYIDFGIGEEMHDNGRQWHHPIFRNPSALRQVLSAPF